MAAKDAFGKIMGTMIPITAFVAIGLEHSIANMYFIPMGIMLKGHGLLQGLLAPGVAEGLNWGSFFWNNLIPVTIGNLIGGVLFVGVIYWHAYLRPPATKLVEVTSQQDMQSAVTR